MNKKIIAVLVLIAVLFVGAIAGTISYYNGVVTDRNSKIALLNNEVANLTSQISHLNDQVTNLTTAHLVAALGVVEIPYYPPPEPIVIPINHLSIDGWVNNTGEGTAYNAGLLVVAYDHGGTLEVNMTVPLSNGRVYGTDAFTDNYVAATFGSSSSLKLGTLYSTQTVTFNLDIYHEGIVTNWTVTPVWTNSP